MLRVQGDATQNRCHPPGSPAEQQGPADSDLAQVSANNRLFVFQILLIVALLAQVHYIIEPLRAPLNHSAFD